MQRREVSDWNDAQIGRMLGRIAALERRVQELEARPVTYPSIFEAITIPTFTSAQWAVEPDHSIPPLSPH